MAKLPLVSGANAAKAFCKAGWITARQTGSHLIMVKQGCMETLSVPMQSEINKGTLRKLISHSGLSVEEFLELL
jgi:predicted RNA binding protein YcfA (HicA-like mRNA interferase family)